MQVRKATPLAIALAALMVSPLALAQSGTASTTGQDAAATQSMAQTNSNISTSMFNQLDTNHDGRVSAAEARVDAGFNGRFSSLDTDHNGYVSSDELTAASSNTGTASTTTDSSTTTTTSGSTEAKPPVTYGNAGDASYDQGSVNATTGNSSDLSSHEASDANATDNTSTTTTTTKHKQKKHKSP
jgi:EF hand